jgi:hypothetical protein
MGEGTPQLRSVYYLLYGSPLPQLRLSSVPPAISTAISAAISAISLYFSINIQQVLEDLA